MATKTFPKVPGIDLCKSKGKNVVFEARINEARRGSKMWLGFDGAYRSSCELQKQTKNSTHSAVNCMWINSLVHFPNHCWLRHVQHHTTPCHLSPNGDDRKSHLTSKGPTMTMPSCPLSRRFLVKMMRMRTGLTLMDIPLFPQVGQKTSISLSLVCFTRP